MSEGAPQSPASPPEKQPAVDVAQLRKDVEAHVKRLKRGLGALSGTSPALEQAEQSLYMKLREALRRTTEFEKEKNPERQQSLANLASAARAQLLGHATENLQRAADAFAEENHTAPVNLLAAGEEKRPKRRPKKSGQPAGSEKMKTQGKRSDSRRKSRKGRKGGVPASDVPALPKAEEEPFDPHSVASMQTIEEQLLSREGNRLLVAQGLAEPDPLAKDVIIHRARAPQYLFSQKMQDEMDRAAGRFHGGPGVLPADPDAAEETRAADVSADVPQEPQTPNTVPAFGIAPPVLPNVPYQPLTPQAQEALAPLRIPNGRKEADSSGGVPYAKEQEEPPASSPDVEPVASGTSPSPKEAFRAWAGHAPLRAVEEQLLPVSPAAPFAPQSPDSLVRLSDSELGRTREGELSPVPHAPEESTRRELESAFEELMRVEQSSGHHSPEFMDAERAFRARVHAAGVLPRTAFLDIPLPTDPDELEAYRARLKERQDEIWDAVIGVRDPDTLDGWIARENRWSELDDVEERLFKINSAPGRSAPPVAAAMPVLPASDPLGRIEPDVRALRDEAVAPPTQSADLTRREARTLLGKLIGQAMSGATAARERVRSEGGMVRYLGNRSGELGGRLKQLGIDVGRDAVAAGRGVASVAAHPLGSMEKVAEQGARAGRYLRYLADQSVPLSERLATLRTDLTNSIEGYNKLPLRQKVYVSMALVGGSATAASLGFSGLAGAIASGMYAQRGLGGAGFALNQRRRMEARAASDPKSMWGTASKLEKNLYATGAGVAYSTATAILGHLASEKLTAWLESHLASAPNAPTALDGDVPASPVEPPPTLPPEAPPAAPVLPQAPQPEGHAPETASPAPAPAGDAPGGSETPAPKNGAAGDSAEPPSPIAPAESTRPIAPPTAAEAAPAAPLPAEEITPPAAGSLESAPEAFEVPPVYATAAPGQGYEHMLRHLWDELQGRNLDPHMFPEGSDVRVLLEAKPETISGVVHRLAMDPQHGFFDAKTGASVIIRPDQMLAFDTNGQAMLMDQSGFASIHATETATTPPPPERTALSTSTERLTPDDLDDSYDPPVSGGGDVPQEGEVPPSPDGGTMAEAALASAALAGSAPEADERAPAPSLEAEAASSVPVAETPQPLLADGTPLDLRTPAVYEVRGTDGKTYLFAEGGTEAERLDFLAKRFAPTHPDAEVRYAAATKNGGVDLVTFGKPPQGFFSRLFSARPAAPTEFLRRVA